MAKASPYESGELTDSIFFTLLVLVEPIHGYLIMQKVAQLTKDNIIIGPATMYTTLAKMVKAGWIEERTVEEAKKEYEITDFGREVLQKNLEQRRFLLQAAEDFLGGKKGE